MLGPPLGRAVLDRDVLAFHVAELAKFLLEGLDELRNSRRGTAEPPDPIELPRLLRLGGERREDGGHTASHERTARDHPHHVGFLVSVSARSGQCVMLISRYIALAVCQCSPAPAPIGGAYSPTGNSPWWTNVWTRFAVSTSVV